jgi:hypothetical protein
MDDMMKRTDSMPKTTDVLTSARDGVVGAFDKAANTLHDKADDMPGRRMAAITDRTANVLDATGRYVRDLGERDVMEDLSDLAKRHPGKSMLAVAALSFLVGRALTRPQS